MRLYKLLKTYSKKNIIAMHMPGHKRHTFLHNKLPYKLDITEIDGFDNLHNAEGVLKNCQQKATKLFGTRKSFYLVNGSTCGIEASIKTCCNLGDKIIIPKNCHKSVYHTIELLNLKCVFVDTQTDDNNIIKDISYKQLDKVLKSNPDAKCVLITSPTFEGVISDIKKISSVTHKYNIPLIVDEAHGSHLFLENKSAINLGADIVINSLHKTLPSLTQTAILHVCSKRIDINKIQHNLSIFMSSSPSYILMSAIDECVEFLIKNGKKYYQKLQNNLFLFKQLSNNLKYIKILNNNKKEYFNLDNSKITIITTNCNISGQQLMQKLRQQKIELEMCYTNYALAYATIFDTKKDFLKLYKALKKIDNTLTDKKKLINFNNFIPNIKYTICDALSKENEIIKFKNCLNRVCGEYIWIYPPGIPILVPGEIITKDIYTYITNAQKCDLDIKSTKWLMPNKICVVKDLTKQ